MNKKLISKKEAYEAMIHLLFEYYKETGSTDLTDILSGGEYKPESDDPIDLMFKYMWDEITDKVINDKIPPKRKKWA